MVGAFGDVIPRANERLELRVGRVDFPGHRRLRGLLLDDLGRELLELAQHRCREWKHLDLPFELRLELLECDRVLRMEIGDAVDLTCCRGMVERPTELNGKLVVCLLVEAEAVCGAGLM